MKLSHLLLSLSFLFILSCGRPDKSKTIAVNTTADTSPKIEVIDFHGTHRCMTCNAIEANTKYTLETYFTEQMKEGKITFQTINVDEEENYDMAEKFEAVSTALFLNVISNGEERHIDLTDFAFMKGTEQAEFSAELKNKIETELKTL